MGPCLGWLKQVAVLIFGIIYCSQETDNEQIFYWSLNALIRKNTSDQVHNRTISHSFQEKNHKQPSIATKVFGLFLHSLMLASFYSVSCRLQWAVYNCIRFMVLVIPRVEGICSDLKIQLFIVSFSMQITCMPN
jgi:hypothetical protein